MPRGDPPVQLNPTTYDAWLNENPKTVDGGPIEPEPDLDYDDEDAIIIPAHHIKSQILPEHYADKVMIFSEYNEFVGIKIYVTPKGYDYLLMAHQTHKKGEFRTEDGGVYGDYPHFHELNFFRISRDGDRPETSRKVPTELFAGISSVQLLDVFMSNYHIDDNHTDPIQSPIRLGGQRQRGLNEFAN